jgi:hypothetical protein
MVMDEPYGYERVLGDSAKYRAVVSNEKFLALWRKYLAEEGFQAMYRPFADLCKRLSFGGSVLGILVMVID